MKTESLEVHYFFPFHHGVDRAFSEDGTTFHYNRLSSYFDVAILVASYVLDLLAFLFTFLSPSSEERSLRRLLFQTSITEQRWHHYTAEPCVHQVSRPDAYFMIQHYEHDFFEKLGEIAKNVLEMHYPPTRLFPHELLYPIHGLVAHPDSSDATGAILSSKAPRAENTIIARMVHLGFIRLRHHSFSKHPELAATHYVSHKEFIQKTEEARQTLIHDLRQVRMDFQSPFVLFFNRRQFTKDLEAFYTSWRTYCRSHELLRELSAVHAQNDHRQKYCEALEEMRYEHLFFRSALQVDQPPDTLELYDRLCAVLNLQDPLNWWLPPEEFAISTVVENALSHAKAADTERKLQDQSFQAISTSILENFPQSKTAEMLR